MSQGALTAIKSQASARQINTRNGKLLTTTLLGMTHKESSGVQDHSQACVGVLPEHCKVPLAAVSLRPTHKVLIVLVDSIVGQVHVGRLQIAGLQAPDLD